MREYGKPDAQRVARSAYAVSLGARIDPSGGEPLAFAGKRGAVPS